MQGERVYPNGAPPKSSEMVLQIMKQINQVHQHVSLNMETGNENEVQKTIWDRNITSGSPMEHSRDLLNLLYRGETLSGKIHCRVSIWTHLGKNKVPISHSFQLLY